MENLCPVQSVCSLHLCPAGLGGFVLLSAGPAGTAFLSLAPVQHRQHARE